MDHWLGWLIAIGLTGVAGLVIWLLTRAGARVHEEQDRREHLRVVNAARARSGLPPVTPEELAAGEAGPGRAAAPGGSTVAPGGSAAAPAVQGGKSGKDGKEDQPLHSVVLLETELPPTTQEKLKATFERAWGVRFSTGPDAMDYVVYDPEKQDPDRPMPALIQCAGLMFLHHRIARPYVSDPQAQAKKIREARQRQVMATHRAWRSIDFLRADDGPPKLEGLYALLGKAAAGLAGPTTIGIYLPHTGGLYPCTVEVLKALLSDDPLQSLEQVKVDWIQTVSDESGEVKRAMQEARRRFGEFVADFERRDPLDRDTGYFIKAGFRYSDPESEEGSVEHMWLTVTAIEGGRIVGVLESEPMSVPGLFLGDSVTVRVEDVSDWLIAGKDRKVGGFTIEAIERDQQRGQDTQ